MLPTSQDKRQPKHRSPKAPALAILLGPGSPWEPRREQAARANKDPPAFISTAVENGPPHKGQRPH